MRFEFLKEHRGEIGPIKKACGLMKVSKSGFYEYLGRKKSNAQIEREALEGFVVEAFEWHKGRYGYRRVSRELRKGGIVVGEKRVLRIMLKLGLAGRGVTRKRRIQKKVEPGDPRLNLVERAFTVGERNRLWVGDITCIPTGEGRPYLAAVIDAFSRKVVGWSMSERITERSRLTRWSRRLAGRVRRMTAASSSMTIRALSTPPVPSSDVWTRMAWSSRYQGPTRRWTTRWPSRSSRR